MPHETIVDRIARLCGNALSWLFLFAVVFTFYEVTMRYGFNAPTTWVHELTIGLSAVAFIVSGAYTMGRGDHIRIRLVYAKLPRLARRALDVLNGLITLGFLGALGYGAWQQAARAIAVGERTGTASNLPIPVAVKTVLVIGVALMALQTLAHLIRTLRGRPSPSSAENA